jgi:hypothetical protein
MAKMRTLKIYKAYPFRVYDPAIVRVLSAIDGTSFAQIDRDGGPAPGTLTSWKKKKTRRPQHCTLEAALRAAGKRFGDIVDL